MDVALRFDDLAGPAGNVDHLIDFAKDLVFEAQHALVGAARWQEPELAILLRLAVIEVGDQRNGQRQLELAAEVQRDAGADGALGNDGITAGGGCATRPA